MPARPIIPANNGTEVVGNTGGRGEPTNGAFSALNGDDNLRGGAGVDTLDGNTGDDRLTAGRNSDLQFRELYDGGRTSW